MKVIIYRDKETKKIVRDAGDDYKTGDCEKCEVKPACINNITRPPQSWQYVEELC